MSKALVIGNGESRIGIDLSKIKDRYVLVGCNAIHRDVKVDHLICCDRRMAEEATNNPDTKSTFIYVRDSWYHYYRKILKNKNIKEVPQVPYQGNLKQDQPEHWGSGGYAVLVAAAEGFTDVSLIGFDLYSKNNNVNNVYKGTENYSKAESQSVDHSYWIYQIAQVFIHYPNINFTIFNEADWALPKEWQLPNVKFENISQLSVDL